jgi:hypothetical protein
MPDDDPYDIGLMIYVSCLMIYVFIYTKTCIHATCMIGGANALKDDPA